MSARLIARGEPRRVYKVPTRRTVAESAPKGCPYPVAFETYNLPDNRAPYFTADTFLADWAADMTFTSRLPYRDEQGRRVWNAARFTLRPYSVQPDPESWAHVHEWHVVAVTVPPGWELDHAYAFGCMANALETVAPECAPFGYGRLT